MPVRAQETSPAAADTTQNAALRAFLERDERGCDRDFLVTEVKLIHWMRDRLDADFHILVTSQTTGAGGRQHAVLYTVGAHSFRYQEITVFTVREETRPVHTLDATYSARQPWGEAKVTICGTPYLDGFKYYNAG